MIKLILIIIFLSGIVFSQTTSRIDFDAGTTIDIGTGADVCANEIFINGAYSGGGTICDGPSPVTMITFTASTEKNNVKLNWTTENEINNSGFDLERKLIKEGAVWQKIKFIPGSGTTNGQKSYFYEDKKLQTGKYEYRLKQIDYNNSYEYYNLNNDIVISAPKEFRVSQNYPNPSNPKCRIDYNIPSDGMVSMKVYDIIGREVASLVNKFQTADYYSIEFDGTNYASGIYYYQLKTINFVETKKMILVK